MKMTYLPPTTKLGSTQQSHPRAVPNSAPTTLWPLRLSSPSTGDGPLTTGAGEPPGLHPRSSVHYILYVPNAKTPPT